MMIINLQGRVRAPGNRYAPNGDASLDSTVIHLITR
jgi:hypothetical protein